MMNFRALLLAVTLAFAPLTLHAQAQQTQPIDRIAAVVNEEVILQSELDRAIANITAQYASNPGQLPPPEVLAKQVLERLILTRLQVARAQESGIRVNDQEIEQPRRRLAEQANQLSGQQNGKKRDEDARCRLGELAPGGALEDHVLTWSKYCGDN